MPGGSTGALRDTRQQVLFSDAFGLVCAAGHPLAHGGGPIMLSDLTGQPFLRNELCSGIQTPGFQRLLAGTHVSAQNTLSLIAMVRSRQWVTVLPRSVVHIDPQQLVFRDIADLRERRQVDLLVRTTDKNRAFVQDFVDILTGTDWTL